MKKWMYNLPEVFLLLLSAYWFLDNFILNKNFNIFALITILLLASQLIFANKLIGVFLGFITSLFSLYMMLAVLDEFNDFKTINSQAIQLLLFGLFLFGVSFLLGILMCYKYITLSRKLKI